MQLLVVCVSLICALLIDLSSSKVISYEGHSVIRLFVNSTDQVKLINLISSGYDSHDFELWTLPVAGHSVLCHLSDNIRLEVLAMLSSFNIPFDVISTNMQALINQQMNSNVSKYQNSPFMFAEPTRRTSFKYDQYNRLEWINAQLNNLANANSELMKVEVLGMTAESRKILVAVLGRNPKAKSIVFECGIHAREWVSHATCMNIIRSLLEQDVKLLDRFNFHIIPVLNPDGYVYTWYYQRIWRRNRQPTVSSGHEHCVGVDLNRNFDVDFGKVGVSHDPCDQLFAGYDAFSAPETSAIRDYLTKLSGHREGPSDEKNTEILSYFALHSFTQKWMYPHGYTDEPTKDWKLLDRLSKLAVDEIFRTGGQEYGYGSIAKTIYKVSGSSIDWVHTKLGVTVAFAVELRDLGQQGFLLHPAFIKPTFEEFWSAAKAILSDDYFN